MRLTGLMVGAILAAVGAQASDLPPTLASPYRPYSLKLSPVFTPSTQTTGLFLKVRVDGRYSLRMLLDSGAQHIVLDKHAAAALKQSPGPLLDLVGIGTPTGAAHRMTVDRLEIGDLLFRDCEVLVLDSRLGEGIDGVIPLSLFAAFSVRLDLAATTLYLEPYCPDAAQRRDGYSRFRADNSLLFLDALINEAHAGYVLLDTGASYNAVSRSAAAGWNHSGPAISLRAGTGATDGLLLSPGIRFRFGQQVVTADPAVMVDLSDLARHHHLEVAGVLGYPALRRSVVTINYRDGLVRIQGK